jgi:cytochrome c oxidase subunit 4
MTGLTVAVAGINLANLTVITAVTIATVKSYLVLDVFMHLKHENKVFWLFVAVAMFFLGVSLILLFADYTFLTR